MMVEKVKEGIRVAPWLIGIIVTLALALMSFTVGVSVKAGATEAGMNHNKEQIDENKADIKKLENDKADKEDVTIIREQLIRMEGKLDKIMEEN